MLKHIFLVGVATVCLTLPAWAQSNVITENVNNTGIPRQTPSLSLGQIYGLNPCATGATAGLTTPLFGIAGAVSSIDRECETRNNAAVVITGLKDENLAREILCEIKDVRDAAVRLGKPCLRDQSAAKVASAAPVSPAQPEAPVATAQPVAAAAPAVAATPAVATIRSDAPAFCRVKNLDVSLYPDCTAAPAPASFIGPRGPAAQPTKSSQSPAASKRPSSASETGVAVALSEKRPVWSPQHVQQAAWHSPAPKITHEALPPIQATTDPTTPAACGQRPDARSASGCQTIAGSLLTLEEALVERRRSATSMVAKTGDGASAQTLAASATTSSNGRALLASASMPQH